MNYLKSEIRGKLIMLVALSATLCHAGELSVYARQTRDSIEFHIENTTGKIVFLGDPEKSGIQVNVKSDKIEGGVASSVFMSSHPWKHLILLTAKEEDSPHLWSHKFSLKANRIEVGKIKKIEVVLWMASEEEYLKAIQDREKDGIIPRLKQVRLEAKILESENNEADSLGPPPANKPPSSPSSPSQQSQQSQVPQVPDARSNRHGPTSSLPFN